MSQTTATRPNTEHPAYSHYQAVMAAGSTLRARELAKELGITEGDLVACRQNMRHLAAMRTLSPFIS